MHTGQYIKRRIHGVYESHEPGAEIIPRKRRGAEILSYRVYPIHEHTGGIAYHHEQHILYKARFILEQSIQAYAYQQEIPCAIGYYEVLAEGYPVIKGEMYCPHWHLPRLKQTEYYQIGRHIQRKPYLPVVGYPTFYCVHNAFFVRYSRCLHIALCLSLNDNAFRIISVIDIILPNRKKVYPML